WLEQTRPRFGPAIAPRFASIRGYSSAELRAAALQREELRGHLSSLFAREAGALLVVPSAPCRPLARGLPAATIGPFYQRALAIGGLASLAGLPQVSIPIVMPGR